MVGVAPVLTTPRVALQHSRNHSRPSGAAVIEPASELLSGKVVNTPAVVTWKIFVLLAVTHKSPSSGLATMSTALVWKEPWGTGNVVIVPPPLPSGTSFPITVSQSSVYHK